VNTYIIVGMGIGLIAALIIIKAVFRRDKTFDKSKLKTVSPFLQDQGLKSKVREYLAENKKIEAIKYVREMTGAGLLESKDLVESVEMNIDKSFGTFCKTESSAVISPVNISSDDKVLLEKVELLIKNQNKIEAIKMLVSAKKVRLIEAKNMVEAIEDKLKNKI
jgi:ribosomal protein L7/L12